MGCWKTFHTTWSAKIPVDRVSNWSNAIKEYAMSIQAFLQWVTPDGIGHYVGCMPTPIPGKTGDSAWPVYCYGLNGDTRSGLGGSWEQVALTPRPGSTTRFDTLFVAANRQVTLVPASPGVPAHLETRAQGALDDAAPCKSK